MTKSLHFGKHGTTAETDFTVGNDKPHIHVEMNDWPITRLSKIWRAEGHVW